MYNLHRKSLFHKAKKSLPKGYPRHSPTTIVMLRKGVRANPVDLRRLYDTLKSFRKRRTSALTELPTPKTCANRGPETTGPEGNIREWGSIEEMEAVGATSDNEPSLRVFQQTIEPPQLLKRPVGSLSEMPILDPATGPVLPTKILTDVELYNLRKLTNSLNFLLHSPVSIVKEIFYWLGKFRSSPKVLRLLTPHAWELLWALETGPIPSFRSRLIGDMMVSAGAKMSEGQNIAYIGGMFWDGATEEAFNRWTRGAQRWRSPEYWNLGIRMFSIRQEPYTAKYWLGRMTTALGKPEPRSFIPIIMSFNHIYHLKEAWETYKEMQKLSGTGNKITVPQYDDICMSFLDGGGPEYGLKVYKHMVFSNTRALERMQTDIYENLSSAVLAAQDRVQTPEKLNKLSADALKNLPPKIQDKYFYGSWMKNAIRMGRTDLAWYLAQGVMAKQFLPDSIHYDWIIQGFLREKKVGMAEEIAEEMIKSRLQQLKMPKEENRWKDWSSKEAATVEIDPTITQPTEKTLVTGPTPPATIQTFSLLIDYYTRRQRMDKVVNLTTAMSSCRIPPNSYIFNHLLYSLLRVHDIPRLMRSYLMILESPYAKPDLETWNIMWFTMGKRYTQRRRRFEELLSPRALFTDMVKHLRRGQLEKEEANEKMRDIWHTVMKSFMLAKDFPGALIALHTGIKVWNMKVDDTVVCNIVFGVMKEYLRNPGHERPKICPDMIDGWVEQLKARARYYLGRRKRGDKRTVELWKDVKDPEGLLEGLTSLLRDKLGDKSSVKDMTERAKEEMGVGGLEIN